ncbi:MAG: MarR family transcriptional regulator [Cytophagaceae bacterium]|nr:MarR family transcriptional regulator [Cytophagaceae bacterium]MDW8455190.1 MarR family transcriptional regulator [Cytophagaceae bacterium]
MKKEQTVCFNIKVAWHAISRMYNEQASKYGYTAAVGFVLLNIDAQNGTPATKIAPELGMESHSLSRMLKKMEQDKLIYRKPDKSDKRLVKIFLTEKGKENKEIAKRVVKKFNTVVREEVPEEKLQVFFEVIAKINNIIAEKGIY